MDILVVLHLALLLPGCQFLQQGLWQPCGATLAIFPAAIAHFLSSKSHFGDAQCWQT